MTRIISILTASLMASALATAPIYAKDKGENGGSNGNGASQGETANSNDNSASSFAPGQVKEDDETGADNAPGQVKQDGQSAKSKAPGQMKKAANPDDDVDEDTTASTGKVNFGSVISAIRSGKSDLSNVGEDPEFNVVEIDDLMKGKNRPALQNAIDANQSAMESLQTQLATLGLDSEDAERAVAARVEPNGDVTVFVSDQ